MLAQGLRVVLLTLILLGCIYAAADRSGGDHVTLLEDVTIQPGELVPSGAQWKTWELRNDNRFFPLIRLAIGERWTSVEGKAIQVRERVTPRFVWPGQTFEVSVELLIPPTADEDHHVLFFTLQRYEYTLASLPVDLRARTYWP